MQLEVATDARSVLGAVADELFTENRSVDRDIPDAILGTRGRKSIYTDYFSSTVKEWTSRVPSVDCRRGVIPILVDAQSSGGQMRVKWCDMSDSIPNMDQGKSVCSIARTIWLTPIARLTDGFESEVR